MKIALVSDIHGNTVGLDAVIAELDEVRPDVVVCLGDIATGGPDPGGAVDRVAGLGWVAVQGNTDAGAVDMPAWWRDPATRGIPEAAFPAMEITVWSAEQLTRDQQDYLAALPPTEEIDLEAGALLAFHGSPRSFEDFMSASTPTDELDAMLAGANQSLLAGGHTHVPMVRRHGRQTIVNPGSVGMPFAEYGYAGGVDVLSHSAYALLTSSRGLTSIDLRKVPVDSTALQASVADSCMPHAEWWLALRQART